MGYLQSIYKAYDFFNDLYSASSEHSPSAFDTTTVMSLFDDVRHPFSSRPTYLYPILLHQYTTDW
ncbi:hypothetical protein CLAFUW4_09915 [Fulvia fulva]|uniref:Uncharacterized protein n=1 Tax=Passalora fulva TaxID=5499 RepID=A0A9Q8PHW8_PASFU|nr:uncharacterized protein CLAFUR5_12325 [Fulvia fulva]KAK4616009.1 hypothetical protein CLAFUR4_09920 [Fulvia fulva]KAK4616769.1 hypothetical protein CLAFUR0_09914 [Fulvia fulva]UJO22758.1 hypothetical protein CLAFUR5_12325 [Fulvia fulva]WPV19498.1 hypothetical protein CLAFUW4_09915 [Fulvia fulva]WPV33766.1 hypothetical protein CLAFUW7_09917 [Fulvia fulva]